MLANQPDSQPDSQPDWGDTLANQPDSQPDSREHYSPDVISPTRSGSASPVFEGNLRARKVKWGSGAGQEGVRRGVRK
eukprot:999769-Prorocentrum_minimum.AAC.1